MGRRNLHTREEMRELALRAALELLEAGGLAALSMREVARRIGYTVGALYAVFQNLDDLVVQLNERTVTELRRALQDVAARGREPGQRLRLLAAAYLGFALLHTHRWRLVFEHRLPPGQAAPATYRPQTQQIFVLIGENVAPFLRDPADGTVEEVASTLWSAVHGICVLAVVSKLDAGSSTSAQRQLDLLLDRFVRDPVAPRRRAPPGAGRRGGRRQA
jgi:AcrR family transcriptional regulator